jgi:hypothetical protein
VENSLAVNGRASVRIDVRVAGRVADGLEQ